MDLVYAVVLSAAALDRCLRSSYCDCSRRRSRRLTLPESPSPSSRVPGTLDEIASLQHYPRTIVFTNATQFVTHTACDMQSTQHLAMYGLLRADLPSIQLILLVEYLKPSPVFVPTYFRFIACHRSDVPKKRSRPISRQSHLKQYD